MHPPGKAHGDLSSAHLGTAMGGRDEGSGLSDNAAHVEDWRKTQVWAEKCVGGHEDSEALKGADREGQGRLEKSQETRALKVGAAAGDLSFSFYARPSLEVQFFSVSTVSMTDG